MKVFLVILWVILYVGIGMVMEGQLGWSDLTVYYAVVALVGVMLLAIDVLVVIMLWAIDALEGE